MVKVRLDVLLVQRGMVSSRNLAQRLVMAGQVRVNGQLMIKPADRVDEKVELTIQQPPRYVSRGGEKLEAALRAFEFTDLTGKICADVGASTGGFTDCLLQHGASHVYAIDVGYGILHWKIRQDQRVTVMERTNARNITGLPEPVEFVTVDASFISLNILLPVIRGWFSGTGTVIALVKPQFEAGRKEAARGEGVIRDSQIHKQVLHKVLTAAKVDGYGFRGIIRSPLLGPKGNTEFLVWLEVPAAQPIDIDSGIESLFQETK